MFYVFFFLGLSLPFYFLNSFVSHAFANACTDAGGYCSLQSNNNTDVCTQGTSGYIDGNSNQDAACAGSAGNGQGGLYQGVCCVPNPQPPVTSSCGSIGGYCAQTGHQCGIGYTAAQSNYDCGTFSLCCVYTTCDSVGGYCSQLGHGCVNNFTFANSSYDCQYGCCVYNPPPSNCTGGATCNAWSTNGLGTNQCGTVQQQRACWLNAPQECSSVPYTDTRNVFIDNCSANYTCTNGNVCTTNIYVNVYTDYNHDQSKDGNDTGKAGVTISDGGGNNVATDANGHVTFSQKGTGNYNISMTVPAGFQAVGPTQQTVNLTNNNGNVTIKFYLTPLYDISGNAFVDVNHNKNYDSGDNLYTGTTTIHVAGGPTTVSDMTQADGTYDTGQVLESGTYTVSQTHTLPSGYTYTTPISWTVTVGDPAGGAQSPNCAIGGSPDAACGNPNNGSVANLNFGIDLPYRIEGTAFFDRDKDTHFDHGESAYTGGSTIHIAGPTTMDVTATNGIYNTGQVLLPGNYIVSYTSTLPGNYFFTTANSYSVTIGYNPPCSPGTSPDGSCGAPNNGSAGAGSVNNLNFGVSNETVWHQSVCYDVRDDSGTYTNPIPAAPSCGGASGAYDSITNADCSTGAGIIFSCNGTPDFGLGTSNALGWQAGGAGSQQECFVNSGLDVIRTSYEYLLTTARESNITPIDMTTVCGAGGLANCTLPAGLAKGIYLANGDVHMNAYTFPVDPNTPQGFIFLVNGNLYLDGNILVPAGSVAAFSTSGSIYVDKSVGQVVSDPNDPSVNDPNIEGLYSADNSFIVQSYGSSGNFCNADGTPLDKKLNIVGSVITNAAKTGGSFVDSRDLCIYDLSCSSVSLGEGIIDQNLATSYLLSLYGDGGFLNHKLFNWEEIKP